MGEQSVRDGFVVALVAHVEGESYLIAAEIDPQPWLELNWPSLQRLSEVVIIFDDDVNEDLINLHHHRTPFDVLPTLVRDYRVEARVGGTWTTVADVSANRQRRRTHRLPDRVATDGIRVVVKETDGAPAAHVVSVRAYG